MYYQKILEEIIEEIRPTLGEGAVADYIPALAEVDPCQFGIAISTMDGEDFAAGDAFKPFSIQSISKVFNLALAMRLCDDDLWSRVGVEPSGNAFNSLSQLEYEHGIPRNPFINAGALVITDSIISRSSEPVDVILEFARSCAGNPEITYNEEVFRSELAHGHRNRALINYLCSFDNIANDTEQILTTYFYQCSLAMTCMDLARSFRFLANAGRMPGSVSPILSSNQTRRINSLMMTCGTYDEAGEFAFHVGLPCKSGVGGGIVAIVPKQMSICVWSPALGPKGNSLAGMRALELFCQKTGLAIF